MSDTNTGDSTTVPEVVSTCADSTAEVVPSEQDSCPPLPDGSTKKSKKRLREVSVEASTTENEPAVAPVDVKETEAPPKKNRLQSVDPTDPEGAQPPTTPPRINAPLLSASPPHDSKVRQIRKRVKDLSWQEARRMKPEECSTVEVDQQDDGPEVVDAASEGKADDDDSSKSVSAKSDSDKEEIDRTDGEKIIISEDKTDPSAKTLVDSHSRSQPVPSPEPATIEPVPAVVDTEEKHSGADVVDPSISRTSPDSDTSQGKRRRDDEDQNPREPKRISPPPEQEKDEKPKPMKSGGFMSYASAASPFSSSNNSINIFGSTSSPPTFGSTGIPKPPTSMSFPSTTTPLNNMSTPTTYAPAAVTFGTSGFNTYASAASPFAAAKSSLASPFRVTSSCTSPSRVERSKSPGRHAVAFGPYTSRSGKFAAAPSRPSKKRRRETDVNGADSNDVGTCSGSGSGSGDEAGDDDPGSPTSFGDILSAKENHPEVLPEEEKKIEFTEQEVLTGEEDERTEYQVRAKLFAMCPPPFSGWKERGFGTLKLNVHKKTGRARLVLRTDGVLRLILNTSLFKGMDFELAQDPHYVKFGVIVDKKIVLHTLRFTSVKNAEELLEQVKAHTPGISKTDKAGEV